MNNKIKTAGGIVLKNDKFCLYIKEVDGTFQKVK